MLKKIGYQVYKLNFMNRRIFTTAYSDISFYNWNDPQTLIQVVKDQYVLNDLQKGYIALKQRMNKQNRTLYKDEQLFFMIYTAMIMPNKKQIIKDFIQGLKNAQTLPETQSTFPKYLTQSRYLLRTNYLQEQQKQQIKKALLRRQLHPENSQSIQQIHNILRCVSSRQIKQLENLYKKFKYFFQQELQTNQFVIHPLKTKLIIECFDYFHDYDQQTLKQIPTFSDLPLFEHDQKLFQNLLKFLLELVTHSFLHKHSRKDIMTLHNRFNSCKKYQSPQTKRLLDQYACQLVVTNAISAINFQQLLEPI